MQQRSEGAAASHFIFPSPSPSHSLRTALFADFNSQNQDSPYTERTRVYNLHLDKQNLTYKRRICKDMWYKQREFPCRTDCGLSSMESCGEAETDHRLEDINYSLKARLKHSPGTIPSTVSHRGLTSWGFLTLKHYSLREWYFMCCDLWCFLCFSLIPEGLPQFLPGHCTVKNVRIGLPSRTFLSGRRTNFLFSRWPS